MTNIPTHRSVLAVAAAMPVLLHLPARAATRHDVEMLNRDPDQPGTVMVFKPRLLAIAPGESVRFLATAKGHNSQSIEGMIPEGAEPWRGGINEEIEVTFERPGVYGYKCLPHYVMGMVGVIVVRGDGPAPNLEAARAVGHPGRAGTAFEEIFAAAEADGLVT